MGTKESCKKFNFILRIPGSLAWRVQKNERDLSDVGGKENSWEMRNLAKTNSLHAEARWRDRIPLGCLRDRIQY